MNIFVSEDHQRYYVFVILFFPTCTKELIGQTDFFCTAFVLFFNRVRYQLGLFTSLL